MLMRDELYRKALDQMASLQAEHEACRISHESYKIGLETIWYILGGVIQTPEFKELIEAANEEIRSLPLPPLIEVTLDESFHEQEKTKEFSYE